MDFMRRNNPSMLPGEIVEGASGWKERQKRALKRSNDKNDPKRAAIRAARAANRAREAAGVHADPVAAETLETKPAPTPAAIDAAPVDKDDALVIPADWKDMHHFKMIALARQIDPEMAEAIATKDDAISVIEDALKASAV